MCCSEHIALAVLGETLSLQETLASLDVLRILGSQVAVNAREKTRGSFSSSRALLVVCLFILPHWDPSLPLSEVLPQLSIKEGPSHPFLVPWTSNCLWIGSCSSLNKKFPHSLGIWVLGPWLSYCWGLRGAALLEEVCQYGRLSEVNGSLLLLCFFSLLHSLGLRRELSAACLCHPSSLPWLYPSGNTGHNKLSYCGMLV